MTFGAHSLHDKNDHSFCLQTIYREHKNYLYIQGDLLIIKYDSELEKLINIFFIMNRLLLQLMKYNKF